LLLWLDIVYLFSLCVIVTQIGNSRQFSDRGLDDITRAAGSENLSSAPLRLALHFEPARVEVELIVISLFRIDGGILFCGVNQLELRT